MNQKVAQLVLAKLGYRVDSVSNGLEAFHAVRGGGYDVVLMDVQMPVLDGIAATRAIRADVELDRQPHIIAMTASVLIEDEAACRAAGMDSYLTKPIRPQELDEAAGEHRPATCEREPSGPVATIDGPSHGGCSDHEPGDPDVVPLVRVERRPRLRQPVDRTAEDLLRGGEGQS